MAAGRTLAVNMDQSHTHFNTLAGGCKFNNTGSCFTTNQKLTFLALFLTLLLEHSSLHLAGEGGVR